MKQWEYLEIRLDLKKGTWKDNEGRRGTLRKASIAQALNELGIDGWELITVIRQRSDMHRLLLKRRWSAAREVASPEQGEALEGDVGERRGAKAADR